MPRKALENLTESMFYVLMAFVNGPMCGIDAADFIERRSAGRVQVGPATLYTILAKLTEEEMIHEVSVAGRRRSYEITEKGRRMYGGECERLRRCVADIDAEERSHGE